MNIVFKLLDDEFLIADDALDEVTDRHKASYFLSLEYWKMAHALVGHESHTFLDGLLRLHTTTRGSMISRTGVVGDDLPLSMTLRA